MTSEPGSFRTAADIAYDALRNGILSGKLIAGERIDQDAEAAALGVSRMPIREALRRLESEGLVEIVRHRGVLVRSLSIDDLEDLYVLRIALEGVAGRLGAENLDPAHLDRMCALFPEMEAIVADGDPDRWLAVDWVFHSTLYDAAHRPRLFALISSLRDEVGRYRRIGLAQPQELEISLQGHHDMLAAIARADGVAVERLIQSSLDRSRERLRRYLEERGGDIGPMGKH